MDFEPIVNRVAESDLVVFNLEDFWDGHEIVTLDIAPFLFKGLILKEKDFRAAVSELDRAEYAGRHVAVTCSTNAVIPTWAYMLVTAKLAPVAASVSLGTREELIRDRISTALAGHDWSDYSGRNVIVKGCPSAVIPVSAYLDAVSRLQSVAAKIMYGEACSSVPIWRRPAANSSPSAAPADGAGTTRAAKKPVSAKLPKSS